jgi:hypothetical protein
MPGYSRRTRPKARTVAAKRLDSVERTAAQQLAEGEPTDRPRTRGECKDGPRPCPYASCRFHLYVDVSPATGALRLNFPDLEPWELTETCALDVADRGGAILEKVGALMNVTRERVRQIETRGLLKLRAATSSEER